MIDHLCHPESGGTAWAVFQDLEWLDQQLEKFDQYPEDFLRHVMPAEDDRWHTPPGEPIGHLVQPCLLCIGASFAALPNGRTA